MKLSVASSCIALLSLLYSAAAFPTGAGRCVEGEASAAPHGGQSTDLASGGYSVTVNGNQVAPSNGAIVVPPDTDFDITLSGSDFRGFLIMLGGQPEGALVGPDGISKQADGSGCELTASITHTSNDVKQSVTVSGNLPAGTVTTIEVNVVVQNSGGVSIYHYDQFTLEVELPSETGSPTGSPVAISSPATQSPAGSPINGNTTSIADLVLTTPVLSNLSSLLTTELIASLSGDGPFTVFAPTNDAFNKIPEDVISALAADGAALVDVLTYHGKV